MQAVEQILQQTIDRKQSPSVQYILFNSDQVIYQFRAGYADIKSARPVTEETTYNLYSITKTFTALAVLQLTEQNLLKIDDPVINYLPGFPYTRSITIRQLLSHTAGIPNPIPISWIHLASEHHNFDQDAFFARQFSAHAKTRATPNVRFAYSNLGYIILGQLIEAVSGKRYEDYVSDHIIRPLNLSGNMLSFTIHDPVNRATGYHKKWSLSYYLLGWLIDKQKYMDTAIVNWGPFNLIYVNGAPYGGLIGNSKALVCYIRELIRYGSPLLSEAAKELLFQENYTNDGKATGMCLSWYKSKLNGKTYFTHAGGGGGYYVEMRIYPEQNLGSVILFNRTGMRDERFLDKLDIYFI